MKLARDPWSASSDIAHARSAPVASRRARTSASAPTAAMNCVPLMRRGPPSPAAGPARARRARAPRRRAGARRRATPALADERQREVRERSKVAARPDRAAARHVREHAAVDALDQELDRLDPRARVALRERVRAQQHRRAHDLRRVRLADAAGVAAQQPQLQLLGQLLRDRRRDEASEAGVDPVRVLAVPCAARSTSSRAASHPRARASASATGALDRDLPDVVDGEVLAAQRATLDHARV